MVVMKAVDMPLYILHKTFYTLQEQVHSKRYYHLLSSMHTRVTSEGVIQTTKY